MRPWPTLLPLFILAGMALASEAWAAGPVIHCVSSSADIIATLAVAAQEDDVEVRVVAGIYPMPESFGLNHKGDGLARFSGGWDTSCLHQTPNTLLTILEPEPGGQPIGATFEDYEGDLEIDTLTFQDMKYGVVVYLGDQDGWPTHRASLRNCAFLRDGSVRIERLGAPDCDRFMQIGFRNNLVADSQDPTLATELTVCWHDHLDITHGTFANSPGAGLGVYGANFATVTNSAFSHNARSVVWGAANDPFIYFCGNVGDDLVPHVGSGDCTVAQNFVADPQLGFTFLPLPGSPVINFGRRPQDLAGFQIDFPDFDLGGGARFVGTRPDAGVYEVQASCAP